MTLDPEGAPRSRLLLRLRVKRSGIVWMATDAGSQKVDDIRRDPRVSLSAFDGAVLAVATWEGRAEVVDDESLLKQHWLPALKLYFTHGQKDERYVLLKIVPATFGLVDFSTDVTPEPFEMRRVSAAVPAVRG